MTIEEFAVLGHKLTLADSLEIRQQLLKRLHPYMFDDRLATLPMACRIKPQKQSSRFEESWLPKCGELSAYFENYDLMVLTTAERISNFLRQREPWQDFDVCFFDEKMTWCAALTHNDEMKYICFT